MYDVVVIGAGPGGYVTAIRAAQLGLKTAVIENRDIGGTCLNLGCIPTKTLLYAADMYYEARHGFESVGLCAPDVSYDPVKLYARKDEVVQQMRDGVEKLLKGNHVSIHKGTGVITAPGKVRVDLAEGSSEELEAGHIIIATGSVPSRPDFPGCGLPGVVTSDELLNAGGKIYNRLVVLGAGVIAIEFADLFARLGCEVTVAVRSSLLRVWSRDISQNLSMIFRKHGIRIYETTTIRSTEAAEGGLLCHFISREKPLDLYADGVLVANGRAPFTDSLFGDGVSIATERGHILVNDDFETSMAGVYAIGDVTGKTQLAHAASAQGVFVAERITGTVPQINLNLVPSCIYTDPEIACVGLTEDQAAERGIKAITGKYVMNGNGKCLIQMSERSFVKLVADAGTGKLVGAQLMCPRASDMISELSLAIARGVTAEELAGVIHPHPTFGEGIAEAAETLLGHSIHTMPKWK
jgi:dihydrolipoamide dehydrogenase